MYAGFWIRLGAFFLDSFFLQIAYVAISILLLVFSIHISPDMTSNMHLGEEPSLTGVLLIIFPFILYIAYYVVFTGGKWQATPGKKICGIYVKQTNNGRISYLRAFWRYLCYIPSTIVFFLGFVMIAFTKEKRGLHDYLANTVVVYGKPQ